MNLASSNRVFDRPVRSALLVCLLLSTTQAEPRKFQVYLANPRAQWIPDEAGAGSEGGSPADTSMLPTPARVDQTYFDPVIGGLDGVGSQPEVNSLVEWWYQASYGDVTVEDRTVNQHTHGWFDIQWPITPKNNSDEFETPQDFINLNGIPRMQYGVAEPFTDGLTMILIDRLSNDGPPNGANQPTPDSSAGSPLAADGAWTPGERFMDLDPDGRYDSLQEYYSLRDIDGDCKCNDPFALLDELPEDLLDACEEQTDQDLQDFLDSTDPPGTCPGSCPMGPPCCLVRGCDSDDFYHPLRPNATEIAGGRPEPYEDYLVFRDRQGRITNGGMAYTSVDDYYQPVPLPYIRDNYAGDDVALIARTNPNGISDLAWSNAAKGGDPPVGNNRYDPPERWNPLGNNTYIVGESVDFDETYLNDQGQTERKLEEAGGVGDSSQQPTWYEEFWRVRYGMDDTQTPPAWLPSDAELLLPIVPNMVLYDASAALDFADQHPDRIGFRPNKGGRQGYGFAWEQELQFAYQQCVTSGSLQITACSDVPPTGDCLMWARTCCGEHNGTDGVFSGVTNCADWNPKYGDGTWQDPDDPQDTGEPIYPSPSMVYNGPKEYDDLPSSIYHTKWGLLVDLNGCLLDDDGQVICGNAAACGVQCSQVPASLLLQLVVPVLIDYGGNQTFGEVTSSDPYTQMNRNPWGADRSTSSQGQDLIAAGPLAGGTPATSVHGSGQTQAGNVLSLEYVTWVRNLSGVAPAVPIDQTGDNEVGAGQMFNMYRTMQAMPPLPPRGFADFNLDGLLDLGEGVAHPGYRDLDDDGTPETYVGVESYAVDPFPDTENDGVRTAYPYNRQRLIEDVIEVLDPVVNFTGQVNNVRGFPAIDGITLLPGGMQDSFDLPAGVAEVDGVVFSTPVGGGNFMPIYDLQLPDTSLPFSTRLTFSQLVVWDMPILLDRGNPGNVERESEGKFKNAFACHELGHYWQGWPDLYDTSFINSPGAPTEDPMNGWDIMDNGQAGYLPFVNTNAVFKHNSQWIDPVDLTAVLTPGQEKTITILGCEAPNPQNSYFVYPNQFVPEFDCFQFTNQSACNLSGTCLWNATAGICEIIDCAEITNQFVCNSIPFCSWGAESQSCEGSGSGVRERYDFWVISDTRPNTGNEPMLGNQYPWGNVTFEGGVMGGALQTNFTPDLRADGCIDGEAPGGFPQSGLLVMRSNIQADAAALPPAQILPSNVTYGLIQADGEGDLSGVGFPGDNGDLFPGSCDTTTWGPDTIPDNRWQTATFGISGIEIHDIEVFPINPVTGFASANVTFFWQPQDTPSLTFINTDGITSVGNNLPVVIRAYDVYGGTTIYIFRQPGNPNNPGVPPNNYLGSQLSSNCGSIGGQPSPFLKLNTLGPKDKTGVFNVDLNCFSNDIWYFYAFLKPGTGSGGNEFEFSPVRPGVENVGSGEVVINNIVLSPTNPNSARAEAWTLTFAGVNKWNVVGSLSGPQATQATTGQAYNTTNPPGAVRFTITGSGFAAGDRFIFTTAGFTAYSPPVQVENNTVGPHPTAVFDILPGPVGKPGDVFTFDAGDSTNVPGVPGGLTYGWDFGDGSPPEIGTDPSVQYSFDAPGNYTVTLVVVNEFGQFDIATAGVVIQNTPPVLVLTTDPSPAAGGNPSLAVKFVANATSPDNHDISKFEFDFQYLANANLTQCQSNAANFQANVTTNAPPGNGGQATAVVTHVYQNIFNGLAAVRVTDSVGESTIRCARIDAGNRAPTAVITVTERSPNANGVFEVFLGQPVHFSAAQSTDPDVSDLGSLSYLWSFGDGSTSTLAEVDHTFTQVGALTVSLTVTDPDGASHTDTVGVKVLLPAPNTISASISATPVSGPSPLTVRLTAIASSENPGTLTYRWELDDAGAVKYGQIVTYQYVNAGTVTQIFTPKLIVTDQTGAQGTATVTISVHPAGDGGVDDPNLIASLTLASGEASGEAPLLVQFSTEGSRSLDGKPVTVMIDFDDRTPPTTVLPGGVVMHTYMAAGEYQATATVISDSGGQAVSDPVVIIVDASGRPAASISADRLNGVAPLAVRFDASASTDPEDQPLTFTWDFGDDTPPATGAVVTHTFFVADIYTVELTAIDSTGTGGSATVSVTVDKAPDGPVTQPVPPVPPVPPALGEGGICGQGCGPMGATQLLLTLISLLGLKKTRRFRR